MSDQPQDRVYPVNIEEIMHTAYLQYSLSVNVGRAIPDVRDGLKPVNRRILYGMRQLSLTHARPYAKCARVVGEVMGNYHPHGDAAIYDTLVRMAQDFSMRMPLIDGQGNFGSIDGDPPAAQRYTECRMSRLAEELLADLEKDTVDMMPNYDEKLLEPVVLPARYPNLLVNGSTGIGVGMATSIPPHNLGEVIDATVHLIDHPQAVVRDLLQFIKGPDFPTGATLVGVQPIMELYETGHGVLTIRGRATVEEGKDGREKIIITEIPYAVNKEMLVKRIAELANEKVITGISDLHDLSSSRAGIRIEVEVKRNEMGTVVLNQLYKHTMLQTSFGSQFLVVDKNRPRTLTLVQMLQAYIDHRLEVVTRRCRFELERAEARAHILEGLIKAVENIDEVVALIRASRTRDEAAAQLTARFALSRKQTQAILEMRLHQLVGLAIDELRQEYTAVQAEIARLQALLADRGLRLGVIKTELLEVKSKFASERRTDIVAGGDEINIEDLIQRTICVITVSNTGYIKRQPVDVFRTQRRGGKGIIAMQTKDEDYVAHLFTACTHDYILFFTNQGQMHWLKVYEIPEAQRQSRGKAIVNLIDVAPGEQIRAMLTVSDVVNNPGYLVFCTRRGTIKKTALAEFSNLRRVGLRAIVLDEDDDLIEVLLTNGSQQIMLFSTQGMAVRFHEDEVRAMGRATRGVIGIRLGKREDDEVVAMTVMNDHDEILNITALGMGKRSNIGVGNAEQDEGIGGGYRLTSRGSMGVISMRLKEGDRLVSALRVTRGADLMITTVEGQMVRMSTDEIRTIGRSAQGVRMIDLRGDDQVAGVSLVEELPEDEAAAAPEGEAAPGEPPAAEAPPAQ
jgi:DNA gyrase subunit A